MTSKTPLTDHLAAVANRPEDAERRIEWFVAAARRERVASNAPRQIRHS